MVQRYTVLFEQEKDGGYHAFCPALPGCHSQGETLEETMANIQEAMDVYVESLLASGKRFHVKIC